jgi:antitoxin component of MazEF toxin-antitoxin module
MATPDDVTIRREGDSAVIKFNNSETSDVHLKIGADIESMSDSEILELHNDVVRSQLELAANWRPTEIADGHPQVKFDRASGQWSAKGHVLRCVIGSGPYTNEPTIEIDHHQLSLQEFGTLLSHFEGWGMRILFVSEDQLRNPPAPEVCNAPKRISKKELAEIRRENGLM